MTFNNIRRWGKILVAGVVVIGGTLGVLFGFSATAAPPHTVSYRGTPVTTAVPGKPFTLNLQVKNTGGTAYSGVKVIFHVPDGLEHSKVAPANARVEDDLIWWTDVPIRPGESFYPSITFTLKSGTPLGTKLQLWVEVTGSDMEATSTNFSITARATSAPSVTTLSSADISSLFASVYGRAPSVSELKYWLGRRTDKPQRAALLGAMGYHKARGIGH